MINIYYNDWYFLNSNISFFSINTNIIYMYEPSFLDKELYDFIIEPTFSIFN